MEQRKTIETWLEVSEDEQHPRTILHERVHDGYAAEGNTLAELKELIDVAVQLEKLNLDDRKDGHGGGVYYVKASPDKEVYLQYRTVLENGVSMVERTLCINGQEATLSEVIALYNLLRAEQA